MRAPALKARRPVFAAILILGTFLLSAGAAASPADDGLAARIDAVMAKEAKPDAPGAAVIVRRDGQTVFREGYGLANLELGVAVAPDMIFRIGSVTKQFTAVGILMLLEQGKLALDDPLTKFLPDYPTGGKTITLRHLLTHTSGIRSYTEMPEWLPLWRKDFKVPELIDFFKDQPMDFDPGVKWKYDNSGYILLGAVIEKASGLPYAEFLSRNVFQPLKMTGTSYDTVEPVVPRRAAGYSRSGDGYVNAPYLSMTQPYAAGSLQSRVDDLAAWDEALRSGRLVRKETLEQAWTPARLTDGRSTGYGFGWQISTDRGHRLVEHGGGINGFTCHEISAPEDGVYVAVLTNSDSGPVNSERAAFKIAELALGLPQEAPGPAALDAKALDALTGVYENADKAVRFVTREGATLSSQRAGGEKYALTALSATEFLFPDSPTRAVFTLGADGKATGLEIRPRAGMGEAWTRTAKPLPAARTAVKVDPSIYDRYVGEYELAPGFTLTVTREGGRLLSRATGQPAVELFPESETKYFLKVVDAQVEFVPGPGGRAESLLLTQGGRTMPAKRVK